MSARGTEPRADREQVYSIQICAYLGGFDEHKSSSSALFMTVDEVGKFLESKISRPGLVWDSWVGADVVPAASSGQCQGGRCLPPYD